MLTYCEYIRLHPEDSLHKAYHDLEYGYPLQADAALFERLVLEINQAGLSWTTILKKKEAFRRAFEGFEIERVAAYGEVEKARLLGDAGIIRNRLKVAAAIENARRIQALQQQAGSFRAWLDLQGGLTRAEWVKLFKETFVFTGGEIVGEFLLSTGYLAGAHSPDCPAYAEIARLQPAWMRK